MDIDEALKLYSTKRLEAYVDADVYVLPSTYEIFGITILEALACGTPVIVTDRCGIADVIDGKAGLAVPYDKDRLSDAILRMLSDDKMRQQFREKGKLLVRERYNWGKIVEQVEGLYRAVAK
jgi:glycosyltransferase involved in cell wall biosynthesis